MFGGLLAYRLLSGTSVPDIDYNIELTSENIDKIIKPHGIYHCYLETDIECHHFALIYPKSGPAMIWNTYGGIPIFSIIYWGDPISTLTRLFNLNLQVYQDAFKIDVKLEPYKKIKIWVDVQKFTYPTTSDISQVLDEIQEVMETAKFQELLENNRKQVKKIEARKKLATIKSMTEDLKQLRSRLEQL